MIKSDTIWAYYCQLRCWSTKDLVGKTWVCMLYNVNYKHTHLLEPSDISSSTTTQENNSSRSVYKWISTKQEWKCQNNDKRTWPIQALEGGHKDKIIMWTHKTKTKYILNYWTISLTSIQHDGGGLFPFSSNRCLDQWCLNCERNNTWTLKNTNHVCLHHPNTQTTVIFTCTYSNLVCMMVEFGGTCKKTLFWQSNRTSLEVL